MSGVEKKRELEGGEEDPSGTKRAHSGAEGSSVALQEVVEAIRRLKSWKGSGLAAIVKEVGDKVGREEVKEALKEGLANGVLHRLKQSYLVTGENYPDPTPRIVILEDSPPPPSASDEEGGDEAAALGSVVVISYVGTLKADGAEFDAGKITFMIGMGEVVNGMEEAVIGMKVKGVRKVEIPPALGYGKRAVDGIPADSTLIFSIELLSIGDATAYAMDSDEEGGGEEASGDWHGEDD